MTTIDLYKKHKAGEVSREKFLYEVRRDVQLPWIISVTSYDDAIKILKNKGIITETKIEELSPDTKLSAFNKASQKAIAANKDNDPLEKDKRNSQLRTFGGTLDPTTQPKLDAIAGSDLEIKAAMIPAGHGGVDDQSILLRVNKQGNNIANISVQKSSYKMGGGSKDFGDDVSRKLKTAIKYVQDHELANALNTPVDEKLGPISDEDIEIYIDELGSEVDKKVLGKFFAENNLLEKEEDALLKHYGFYENVEDAMDVLRFKNRYRSRRREFAENEEPLNEAKKKQPKALDADHANPYQYRLGIQYELECSDDYTDEGLDKAKAKTLRNLAKDSNYYTALNAKKSHYTFKATETDKPGMQAKADGYLKKELVKNAKANVKDNLGKKEQGTASPKGVKEMTMTPKKAKGISKVMDVPGKPKVVKEGVLFKDFFLTENEEVEVDKKAKSIAKIKAKLKKETKLIKSKTTGTTIDVVPDNQVSDIQASLAKKGVPTTTTDV